MVPVFPQMLATGSTGVPKWRVKPTGDKHVPAVASFVGRWFYRTRSAASLALLPCVLLWWGTITLWCPSRTHSPASLAMLLCTLLWRGTAPLWCPLLRRVDPRGPDTVLPSSAVFIFPSSARGMVRGQRTSSSSLEGGNSSCLCWQDGRRVPSLLETRRGRQGGTVSYDRCAGGIGMHAVGACGAVGGSIT